MYRPVQQTSVQTVLFSDKNYAVLQNVLIQDFQKRNGELDQPQRERLSKTLDHYMNQIYKVQGDKPIQTLNKEILTVCAKDFSQYLQRKELTSNTSPVKTVMDESLFLETSQRFERLTHERNEVKALPPAVPDFRISLDEDSPPAAELYERAKKQREIEALRSKADAGLQLRNNADSSFRSQQDSQNRNTELALVQRQKPKTDSSVDTSLVIMPDRRELLLSPIGSFDSMNGQNPTIIKPTFSSPDKNNLPQNYIIAEEKVVSWRELENNLFIYSADRDWLRNNKENRYNFSVNFDPAANQGFGPSLSSQQKFKNIVRIELVKCIMAGESLDVTVFATGNGPVSFTSNYQDNILNFPYVSVRIVELENNNYGTDNFLDRSFGVLQYDAQWLSDTTNGSVQVPCTKGYFAMIPKFLKCQKDFYPTPLSTLQKMTIEIRRPNGELISTSPDAFDISGITMPGYLFGSSFGSVDASGNPYNFFIHTSTYFSKYNVCVGDRIQIGGYSYPDSILNSDAYGNVLKSFCNWINRAEGHIVIGTCYGTSTVTDGANDVGYANYIVIQARYMNPSTGSTSLDPFSPSLGTILDNVKVGFQTPCRFINYNKQLNLVFRIITREMDSLPQIRPDNNY